MADPSRTGTSPAGDGQRTALDEKYERFAHRFDRAPGGRLGLKVLVFVVGLLFVAGGVVLVVLPGPLTIPPILVGVYVWSFEFAWARRLRTRVMASARQAWEQSKEHPVRAGAITLAGLVLAGVVIWAVLHYDVVQRIHDAIR